MRRAEFLFRYKLFQQITSIGVCSYHGANANGMPVMVHFVKMADSEDTQRIMSMVEQVRERDPLDVVEVAEVDGAPAVVTRPVAGFETLDGWLEMRVGQPATPRRRSRPADPDAETLLVPALSLDRDPQPNAPPRRRPEPDPPAPGEFTRLFEPGVPSAPPAARPGPAPGPSEDLAAAAGAAEGPGDFTNLFGEPIAPSRPVEKPDGPGEFTKLFTPPSPDPSGPETAPPSADPPEQILPPAEGRPGDFTEIFGSSQPPPASRAEDTGGIFSSGRAESPPDEVFRSTASEEHEGKAKPRGDYNRMFRPADFPSPPTPAPGSDTPSMFGELDYSDLSADRDDMGTPSPGRSSSSYVGRLNRDVEPPAFVDPGPTAPSGEAPSEFTRMISGTPESGGAAQASPPPPAPAPSSGPAALYQPPPAANAPPSAAPPQPGPSRALLYTLIGLVIVLFIALVIVLIIAFA